RSRRGDARVVLVGLRTPAHVRSERLRQRSRGVQLSSQVSLASGPGPRARARGSGALGLRARRLVRSDDGYARTTAGVRMASLNGGSVREPEPRLPQAHGAKRRHWAGAARVGTGDAG